MKKLSPFRSQQIIEISTWTIVKTIIILLALYFIFHIRYILLMLFIVTIIVSALKPTVEWLQKKKIPKLVAVSLIFVLILLVIILISIVVFPPLLNQLQQLVVEFPEKLQRYLTQSNTRLQLQIWRDWLVETGLINNFGRALEIVYQQVSNVSAGIINQTFGVLSGAVGIFTVIALTFYLLLEEEGIRTFLISVLPAKSQVSAFKIWQKASKKTGNWLRGQLLISCAICLLTFVGFSILGIKYSLVLAVIAGVANIVPYIGPIAGAIPAIMIALVQNPLLVVGVIIIAALIQQIDSQFITPKIMGSFVGLSPVTIIISLLIGGSLAGMWGVVLAIPLAATIGVIMEEWDNLKT